MFHCNGWCFPWAISAVSGTHVCMRKPAVKDIFRNIIKHDVTHMSAAPVILGIFGVK